MSRRLRDLNISRRHDNGAFFRGMLIAPVLLTLGPFLVSLGYRTWDTFPFSPKVSLALYGVGSLLTVVGYCFLTGKILLTSDDGYYY